MDPTAPGPPWWQYGKCPNCHRLLERNPDDTQHGLDQWRLPPEVFSLGGTVTVRATPTAMGSAGMARTRGAALETDAMGSAGMARTRGAALETDAFPITPVQSTAGSLGVANAAAPSVHIEAGLARDQWDMACAMTGFGVGSLVGKGGAVVGFVTGYIYARRTYPRS
jgi:hypothetical protein